MVRRAKKAKKAPRSKPRRPNVRRARISDLGKPDPKPQLADEAYVEFDCSETGCGPCSVDDENS